MTECQGILDVIIKKLFVPSPFWFWYSTTLLLLKTLLEFLLSIIRVTHYEYITYSAICHENACPNQPSLNKRTNIYPNIGTVDLKKENITTLLGKLLLLEHLLEIV